MTAPAASLEWKQINFRTIPVTCTLIKTKTRSPREINLSERVVHDLKRLHQGRGKSKYVFISPLGERYTNVSGRFRILTSKAMLDKGRHFRCHDLRHTHAIRALQSGAFIYDVARALGHSSVKTTEVYTAWLTRIAR
nr:tyrosine-type recombinase/integrase [Swingsia samuiensis]